MYNKRSFDKNNIMNETNVYHCKNKSDLHKNGISKILKITIKS